MEAEDTAADTFPVAWDEPADAQRTWNRWSTEPCPMLERDFAARYATEARDCFETTGAPICQAHMVRFFNGYWYMGGDEVDPQILSELGQRQWDRGQRWIDQGTSLWEAEIRPELEAILADLRKREPRASGLAPLVAHLERAFSAAAHAMGNLHWHWGPPFSWPAAFNEITGEPLETAMPLLAGVDHKTSRLVRKLRALARQVIASPPLKQALQARDYESIRKFPEFDRALKRLLAEYGRRTGYGYGSATSFSTPTWSIRPGIVLDIVLSYTRADLDALDRAEADARLTRRQAAGRVRRKLAGEPDRLARFEAVYRRALRDSRAHEDGNQLIEQEIMGTMREAIDAAGRRLVAEGATEEADDVLHLSLHELRVAAGRTPPLDLRSIVRARKKEWAAQAKLRAPATIGGPPRDGNREESPAASRDSKFTGFGASAGRATGRARVAEPSPLAPEVEPGEILIARSLGPDWTPIVPLLSGLVLEDPAAHQHGAIIAREFQIPAVIGVRGAKRSIPQGATVTVDGSSGIVTVASGS